MSVSRTEGYTYTANVWALSIVQGAFSAAPNYSSDSQPANLLNGGSAGGRQAAFAQETIGEPAGENSSTADCGETRRHYDVWAVSATSSHR
jgi:hypothetical protein